MPDINYKKALVTGASSGIGKATVHALTNEGIKVIGAARRTEKLEALSKITGCSTLTLDVRDRKSVSKLKDIDIDILVNNAGLGRGFSKIFETNPEDIDITTDTNIAGLLHVLRAVVPGMVKRKRGHIINMGSIAGLYPMASCVYGGSKGAVHLFNQNLRMELSGTGVRATEINPGRVDTEFFNVAFDDQKSIDRKTKGLTLLKSEDIAASIIYAIRAPWRVNVSLIEITPTEQAPGGSVVMKAE